MQQDSVQYQKIKCKAYVVSGQTANKEILKASLQMSPTMSWSISKTQLCNQLVVYATSTGRCCHTIWVINYDTNPFLSRLSDEIPNKE